MIESLSFVIPVHDERASIESVIARCRSAGARISRSFEIVVVDDGSTDGTGALVEALARRDRRIKALHHQENRGIAAATRTGLRAATGDLLLYLDGDGQFAPDDVERLLPHAERHEFVVGYRARRADPWHRRFNAWLYNALLRVLFRLRIRDANCAFKLIRRSSLDRLTLRSDSAFLLAEILIRARACGMSIHEVPVRHFPRRGDRPSGARPRIVCSALLDALRFRCRGGSS